LYPSVDGDVVDVDASFGKQFLDIALGQPVAEVPPHRQQDHLRREPKPCERRRVRTAATNHPGTLRPAPDPSTQQCPAEAASDRGEKAEVSDGEAGMLRTIEATLRGTG
jgi:hypothetical protein